MVRRNRGFTVLELLIVFAIVAMFVSITLPAFGNIKRRFALRSAARQTAGILRYVRSRAISRGSSSAVRFEFREGKWVYAIYDDGDHDGVSTEDITTGTDRRVLGDREVLDGIDSVAIRLPAARLRDPDTRRLLPAGTSPVHFNRSRLCSFGPMGGGTAGSVYLTAADENTAVVRVYGPTGKVRSLLYDRGTGRWH